MEAGEVSDFKEEKDLSCNQTGHPLIKKTSPYHQQGLFFFPPPKGATQHFLSHRCIFKGIQPRFLEDLS